MISPKTKFHDILDNFSHKFYRKFFKIENVKKILVCHGFRCNHVGRKIFELILMMSINSTILFKITIKQIFLIKIYLPSIFHANIVTFALISLHCFMI